MQHRKTRTFYILVILIPEFWIKKRALNDCSLGKAPVPVCSPKLSAFERGSYLDGWPNPGDQVTASDIEIDL